MYECVYCFNSDVVVVYMFSNIVIYQYMHVYVCIYAYGIYTYIYICLYEYVCCFSSNVVIVLLLDVSYNKSLNATLNTSFYFTENQAGHGTGLNCCLQETSSFLFKFNV